MSWKPDDKIVDFGDEFRDMSIPDLDDLVQGEEDPEGTPIPFSEVNSQSALMIANITNNVEFLKRNTLDNSLFSNYDLEISDAASLATAKTFIASLVGNYSGSIFNVKIMANVSVSQSTPLLDFQSISGRGAINIASIGGSWTLENTGSGGVIRINSVSNYIILNSSLSLKCTNGRVVDTSYSRDVVINSPVLGSSGVIGIYALHSDCTIDSTFASGNYQCCDFAYSNIHFNENIIFGLSTQNIINSVESNISFSKLTQSMIPLGASAVGLTEPFNLDSNSTLRIEEYGTTGTGERLDPYTIWMVITDGADYVIKDFNRIVSCFPKKEFDDSVQIRLPAGTFGIDNLKIEHFSGAGSFNVSGWTTIPSSPGETQNSILLTDIEISYCSLTQKIVINSMKFPNIIISSSDNIYMLKCFVTETSQAGVTIGDSDKVVLRENVHDGPSSDQSAILVANGSRAVIDGCISRSGPGAVYRGVAVETGSIAHTIIPAIASVVFSSADSSSIVVPDYN